MSNLTYISILEECKNEVIDKRLNGTPINEIAKHYNVPRDTVTYFMRKHKLNTRNYRNTNEDVKRKVLEGTNGYFEYVSGYVNRESVIVVRCTKCGEQVKRTYHYLTTYGNNSCQRCLERARNRKRIEKERIKIIKSWDTAKGKQVSFSACLECGRLFVPQHGSTKICSTACKHKRVNRWKDKRLNKRNIVDRDITLTKLYQRDKGKCYLCGIVCDWNDKIIDDNGAVIVGATYPTIEHIQPLSKGGLHKWDNVKISCKKCNEMKGSSPPIVL